MICLVGFGFFAFMGLFSAAYREYTRDAWECMKSKASHQCGESECCTESKFSFYEYLPVYESSQVLSE
ncbi:hypothetical protein GLU60_03750 [Nanohaloarchaea archaeon H01]|nr:hypothetical protein [Nanohaloarchaea archaeon H01]